MEPNIKLCVGPPKEFSQAELDNFIEFVVSAGKIARGPIRLLAKNAVAVAILYCDNNLIGSAGLKRPNDTYPERIFNSARASSHANYLLELGWVHVHGNHNGKRYGTKLASAVLEYANDNGIYATTPNDHMRRILSHLGFVNIGNTYKSSNGKEDLSLFIRPAL